MLLVLLLLEEVEDDVVEVEDVVVVLLSPKVPLPARSSMKQSNIHKRAGLGLLLGGLLFAAWRAGPVLGGWDQKGVSRHKGSSDLGFAVFPHGTGVKSKAV